MSRYFFYGPDSSAIKIGVQNLKNKKAFIKTIRTYTIWDSIYYNFPQNTYIKLITPEIGYTDLNKLSVSEVDTMFEMFKNTKSIIFDMRGYPNGTAWEIAPRLNTSGKKVYTAFFEKPMATTERLNKNSKYETLFNLYQSIPETNKPTYNGKIIMLIDERAISQAEHTCFFFKETTNVTFIGSPTRGAHGDVTNLYIPGNISISMTGQSVKHVNGDQLQRIGIIPDIEIKPTINRIRTGKDKVLERAIEFIEKGK